MLSNLLLALSKYHPVVIEGMGKYDPRDPTLVPQYIHSQLERHWSEWQIGKPKLVITQGDPLSERGISAITPRVAKLLGVPRGLVCLDPDIAPYHTLNAERDNVILEVHYSELASFLEERRKGTIQELELAVDRYLEQKNERRKSLGKPPLKDYFRYFALLQEVTKAACRQICGDVTVAHTAQNISDFSVTSFYQAGLELGFVEEHHMVPYAIPDELDFELIDKRW